MEIINNKNSIFEININVLAMHCTAYNNGELINKFFKQFMDLGGYEATGEIEKNHILMVAKVYCDEIKRRIYNANSASIIELANTCKSKFKEINRTKEANDFAVNNMLRVYSMCIKKMKQLKVNSEFIKKEFQ